MTDHELAKIRAALEEADVQLVEALDARARAVRSFVALRERSADAYHALPSSAEVLNRARDAARDFPRDALEVALREILGACAAMLAPVRVAVVGPLGGFAHLAARRRFGSKAEVVSVATVALVFEEVERGRVSYGVVPYETSTDGTVADTLDALVAGESRVSFELTVTCSYDLISTTGNGGDVDCIYGTAQALEACAQTLKQRFPRATALEVKSSTVAEDLVREQHGAAAVVAGFSADDPRQLRLVADRIEDRLGVETRFVVVGAEQPARTGADRTLLAIGVRDEPGSLHQALRPFAERAINLTRIESRAVRGGGWRYAFLVELDGHVTDRAVLAALDDVRAASRSLKVVGSYPRPQ